MREGVMHKNMGIESSRGVLLRSMNPVFCSVSRTDIPINIISHLATESLTNWGLSDTKNYLTLYSTMCSIHFSLDLNKPLTNIVEVASLIDKVVRRQNLASCENYNFKPLLSYFIFYHPINGHFSTF